MKTAHLAGRPASAFERLQRGGNPVARGPPHALVDSPGTVAVDAADTLRARDPAVAQLVEAAQAAVLDGSVVVDSVLTEDGANKLVELKTAVGFGN